jgi:hypothetical protein
LPETPKNKDLSVGTPKSGTKTSKPTGRVSKKALEKAEESRRQEYAQELFTELNASVFKNKLPQDTKLNWNKRLLTTAGRAKYRRYKYFLSLRVKSLMGVTDDDVYEGRGMVLNPLKLN